LAQGASDEQILAALRRLRATFHSQDKHFANPDWRHPRYCLIYYDVPRAKLADYVLRLLRHPFFRTHAKRHRNKFLSVSFDQTFLLKEKFGWKGYPCDARTDKGLGLS